jgi:hypothetical protein
MKEAPRAGPSPLSARDLVVIESQPMRVASDPGWRRGVDRVVRWIEPEANPSSVVYGVIAVGLLLAAEEPYGKTYLSVVAATAVTVGLYWLAHAYAFLLGERLTQPRPWAMHRVGQALQHEWAIVKGAATPVVALVLCWLLGVPLARGVSAALWTTIAALIAFELAVAARARLRGLALVANIAVGAALGAGLLIVKSLLH